MWTSNRRPSRCVGQSFLSHESLCFIRRPQKRWRNMRRLVTGAYDIRDLWLSFCPMTEAPSLTRRQSGLFVICAVNWVGCHRLDVGLLACMTRGIALSAVVCSPGTERVLILM